VGDRLSLGVTNPSFAIVRSGIWPKRPNGGSGLSWASTCSVGYTEIARVENLRRPKFFERYSRPWQRAPAFRWSPPFQRGTRACRADQPWCSLKSLAGPIDVAAAQRLAALAPARIRWRGVGRADESAQSFQHCSAVILDHVVRRAPRLLPAHYSLWRRGNAMPAGVDDQDKTVCRSAVSGWPAPSQA
jgi:hypothetical protein